MSKSLPVIALLLLLPLMTGCERERANLMGPEAPASRSTLSGQSRLSLLAAAEDAYQEQDYDLCASRLAAAARASSGEESATCWYRASQCAARAGDYKSSRFHIQSAASAGFANLHQLRSDPLLRPLRSDPRWPLVDDLVKENDLASSTQARSRALCQAPQQLQRPLRLSTTL